MNEIIITAIMQINGKTEKVYLMRSEDLHIWTTNINSHEYFEKFSSEVAAEDWWKDYGEAMLNSNIDINTVALERMVYSTSLVHKIKNDTVVFMITALNENKEKVYACEQEGAYVWGNSTNDIVTFNTIAKVIRWWNTNRTILVNESTRIIPESIRVEENQAMCVLL